MYSEWGLGFGKRLTRKQLSWMKPKPLLYNIVTNLYNSFFSKG